MNFKDYLRALIGKPKADPLDSIQDQVDRTILGAFSRGQRIEFLYWGEEKVIGYFDRIEPTGHLIVGNVLKRRDNKEQEPIKNSRANHLDVVSRVRNLDEPLFDRDQLYH